MSKASHQFCTAIGCQLCKERHREGVECTHRTFAAIKYLRHKHAIHVVEYKQIVEGIYTLGDEACSQMNRSSQVRCD